MRIRGGKPKAPAKRAFAYFRVGPSDFRSIRSKVDAINLRRNITKPQMPRVPSDECSISWDCLCMVFFIFRQRSTTTAAAEKEKSQKAAAHVLGTAKNRK